MRIGGHGLREHLRLLAPLFGLIAAVWALRLIQHLAGAPHSIVRMFSVNVASAVSVLIAVWLIHLKGFGSYANVVVAAFLLSVFDEILIAGAIGFTALTGMVNIYSSAQYSFGLSYARHIIGHLTFGLGLGTLLGSAMGCLMLWLLRWLVPTQKQGR